jgi:hypothetical protein
MSLKAWNGLWHVQRPRIYSFIHLSTTYSPLPPTRLARLARLAQHRRLQRYLPSSLAHPTIPHCGHLYSQENSRPVNHGVLPARPTPWHQPPSTRTRRLSTLGRPQRLLGLWDICPRKSTGHPTNTNGLRAYHDANKIIMRPGRAASSEQRPLPLPRLPFPPPHALPLTSLSVCLSLPLLVHTPCRLPQPAASPPSRPSGPSSSMASALGGTTTM